MEVRMPGLRFTAGPLAGRRVEVTSALVLGRRAADLVIEDPQVSRRHASVRPAGDALEVEDLGSLNGTWVNGTRIAGPTRLVPGDRVRVGDATFEVESRPTPATPVEEAPTPATPVEEAPTPVPPAHAGPAPPAEPVPAPPAEPVAEPTPPPAPEPVPEPVAPPAHAFDPPPQRQPRRRPGVATRRLTPTLLSFGAVIATAIALVVYFAMR
jgi:pSer/pThr/pTyr-binding forkhead associated (FHA) protein